MGNTGSSSRMPSGIHPDSVAARDPEWFSERQAAIEAASARGDWDDMVKIAREMQERGREIRKAILARMMS